MSTSIMVSVVIPCHNHGIYLNESIASILAQSFTSFEIILVDDGSTEPNTLQKLDEPNLSGVRVYRIPSRQGPAAARNLGIRQATGRYILPLDADDRIGPTYLEKAVAVLESRPEIGIVYCQAEFFGAQSGAWALPPFRLPESIWEPAIFSAAMFRRSDWELAGGYSEEMRSGYEDHDFWLSLIERGRSVYQIPETLFFYRRTPHSLAQSITLDQQLAAYSLLFRRHRELFLQHLDGLFRAFLCREALAQPFHTRPLLQVFWCDPTGHNETSSARVEYGAGDWVAVKLPVQHHAAASVPLRIDPGMQAGCYDLAELQWTDASDSVLSVVPLDNTLARIEGTALALPGLPFVRLLSFGLDPQVILPGLQPPFDSATLQLRLRFLPHLESAADSLALLAARLRAP